MTEFMRLIFWSKFKYNIFIHFGAKIQTFLCYFVLNKLVQLRIIKNGQFLSKVILENYFKIKAKILLKLP